MILTQIGGFSRHHWGIFPQKNGNLQFFFISQIGKHYTNVPNVILDGGGWKTCPDLGNDSWRKTCSTLKSNVYAQNWVLRANARKLL